MTPKQFRKFVKRLLEQALGGNHESIRLLAAMVLAQQFAHAD